MARTVSLERAYVSPRYEQPDGSPRSQACKASCSARSSSPFWNASGASLEQARALPLSQASASKASARTESCGAPRPRENRSPRFAQARALPCLQSFSRRGSATRGSAGCPSPRASERASSAQPSALFALHALRNSCAARASSRRTPSPSCSRFPNSSHAAALPAPHDRSSSTALNAASITTATIIVAIYPNSGAFRSRTSVVGGQVAGGDGFVADIGGERAVLGKEAIERALHVVFGVQLGSDPPEGQPAPPPARVPEQVLAQLADGRQLRLARIHVAKLVPPVRPVRPGTRSAVGASEAVLPLLVLDRHAHVAEDGRAPFAQAHLRRRLSPLERDQLAEDPGVTAGAAGDARGVRPRLRKHAARRLGGEQVPGAPDGDAHCFFGAPDQVPVRTAAIHLRARPRMQPDGDRPSLLARAGDERT